LRTFSRELTCLQRRLAITHRLKYSAIAAPLTVYYGFGAAGGKQAIRN
jgi:hypothetical protein